MDPQHGPRFSPVPERAAFDEPLSGALVTSVARKVEIYGWIGRAKPLCIVWSELFRKMKCRN